VQILIKRKVDGPSVPELGTPTSVTFESITVPLNRASTGPAALAQYELQRSLDGSTWTTIATGPSIFGNPPVQFVDGGRIALTTYYYRARALDVAGRASGYSATVSATTAATIAPSTALVFPRVAIIMNGARHKYDTASWQQSAARYDLALWGLWETWGNDGRLMSFTQACANLKALNPNVKLFVYHNWEASASNDGGVRPVFRNTLNAQNWWLRTSFPSGSVVTINAYGDVFSIPNTFPGGPTLNGQNYAQWVMSTYVRDVYVNGVYPANHPANPHIDGFFFDNVFMMYDKTGDWNRDGVSDAQNNLALGALYRQGVVEGVAAYRALLPGKPFFANNMRGTMQYNPWNLPAPPPEFAGLFDFGLLEFYTGESYSADEWAGPAAMLQFARNHAAQQTKPENQVMFSGRRHTLTSTNFQDARYAIAAQLCASDGYISYKDATGDGGAMETGYETAGKWFDEFGGEGAAHPRYYLGVAEDAVVTASWTSGVYRRRFQNGWVLWNPRGNGVRTVNLGQTMRKLQGRSGFSDTTVNNGAQVTSVTLQDRDGLVLLRG
jgi:hypothetical protein